MSGVPPGSQMSEESLIVLGHAVETADASTGFWRAQTLNMGPK
eukprot:CAMPEP_0177256192 /NCGR_PEP_ID=MMETSP0367-20130122/56797_1 /TAXON_ID=447022 ORGANISM="Scrippsiella hangoei-like, Strain SHHI-4" /NCGR_SAMPLE_ID=MMETSP0367 /ASSEMBLY_ACC=CAM_ASM_000362 /LENGTH=42 /DNA_ID= /DNA_START= /DNA_END= /DNA_ORIENTATION=